ncbi:ABC transporter ATP-binding protein [Kitasatospora sp. MBT66]|uniref:dipeptide ABC transporter ATP-binding protein n=1 Tax=Kitasatospora sp. MBT66 TaxID=1444769 RepID=UPI0007C873CE|nr:ABC transporter ATP-binding protein [Kitasatospora sp. MBT66]
MTTTTTEATAAKAAAGHTGPSVPLVRVEGLRVSFPGAPRPAVDGVSLAVGAGECVALVGESGSGKSVTARSLIGLAGARARVSARTLEVAGADTAGFGERQWRAVRGRRVAMVFQDALTALDPLRTVGAEIAEAARLGGTAGPDSEARVVELLTAVGVPEPEARRTQYPHQLSGGLRQRALIASALAADAPLLIADEPTTALDAIVQAQILALLGRLKDEGRGLLLVSHDLAVVAQLADRVLVLRRGEVVESGPAGRVLSAPEHPYTRMLLDAVPSGRPRARPAQAPPGVAEAADAEAADAGAPDAEEAAPVLTGRGLVKSFAPGGPRALDEVGFTLRAGEALGVVGESGSGKTTLARVAMGLSRPDAGEVLLHGRPWSALPERRRRAGRSAIQFVQQDPYASADPRFTVARIIGEALPGLRRAERARRCAELLDQVGLPAELLSRRPHQLSGGQRQRVAIARALACGPQVLVCDEPVSALDVSVQAQVLELLDRLRRERGIALLFITHDLAVVRQVADRVLIMRGGSVVEEGGTERIFEAPAHPYTRALLDAVLRLPGTEGADRADSAEDASSSEGTGSTEGAAVTGHDDAPEQDTEHAAGQDGEHVPKWET